MQKTTDKPAPPTWAPPAPGYHFRVFVISLIIVLLSLSAFLFGVRMEVTAPATGIITAEDYQEVRTTLAGIVEPGWYEAEVVRAGDSPLGIRVNHQGDGVTQDGRTVRQAQLSDGSQAGEQRFHRLKPGDELWPGQVVASVRDDQVPLPRNDLRVPARGERWMTLEVRVAPDQAVQPGDVMATIVPIDPETHRPRQLLARLQVDEKHVGEVHPEQNVRLYSNMYNARLHGCATALVQRLEPWGEALPGGGRCFYALAPITETPVSLPLGSTFKAEVIIGRKSVYRIILER